MAEMNVTSKSVVERNGNEPITVDSVIRLGRTLAFKALRMMYSYSSEPIFNKLYEQLSFDIHNNKGLSNSTYSDAYDVLQTATAFLCQYIGQNLLDVLSYDNRRKKSVTIMNACFREVALYINHNYLYINKNTLPLDLFAENGKEFCENLCYDAEGELFNHSDYTKERSYDKVEELVSNLKLTTPQYQVLAMRYNGMNNQEIARRFGWSGAAPRMTMLYVQKRYYRLLEGKNIEYMQKLLHTTNVPFLEQNIDEFY